MPTLIAYSRTPLPKSIFLAGPTPRSKDVQSWRPEAVAILERMKFNGTVFVPEDGDFSARFSYDDQVEWELQALHSASVVVFWVPRAEPTMPAYTTNVEFGMFANRPNVVFGAPDEAIKNRYLKAICYLYHRPTYITLESTLAAAVELTERPFTTEP